MLNAMRVQVPVVASSYLILTQSPAANFIVLAALVRVMAVGTLSPTAVAAALLAIVANVPVPAADLPRANSRVFVDAAMVASLQKLMASTRPAAGKRKALNSQSAAGSASMRIHWV